MSLSLIPDEVMAVLTGALIWTVAGGMVGLALGPVTMPLGAAILNLQIPANALASSNIKNLLLIGFMGGGIAGIVVGFPFIVALCALMNVRNGEKENQDTIYEKLGQKALIVLALASWLALIPLAESFLNVDLNSYKDYFIANGVGTLIIVVSALLINMVWKNRQSISGYVNTLFTSTSAQSKSIGASDVSIQKKEDSNPAFNS